jgi:hypothetical protein
MKPTDRQMAALVLGRYTLTDAGREFVPGRPVPRFDGETWAQF